AVMVPELRTIEEVVTAEPRFATLRTAIEAAGLGVQLGKSNPGPWTLLAPSNDAFGAVPADALAALLKDKGALTAVLAGHVLPTAIHRDEMLSQGSARTLLGHSPLIAASHYLQPSDHNFRAVAGEGPWITSKDGAEGGVPGGVQVAYGKA
ncbi:MAG: fasciclin domain-containing protein, partial [Proteobacteria bacterium]|nr:fasciclin domain-containing protein [Pseudomonadota bacterium]